MTAWSTIYTRGLVSEDELDVLYMPRGGPGGRRGILLCHGAGGDALYANDPTVPGALELFHRLASEGFTMLSSDWGGPGTWGNGHAVTRLESGRLVLAALGCAPDKVALVGVSMGGLNALSYAISHPDRVAAIGAVVPAADPQDMLDLYPGWAAIAKAWGVEPGERLPDRARPISASDSLRRCGPIHMYYSTADQYTRAGPIEALAEAIHQPATIVSTTLDHSDDEVAAVPKDELVEILRRAGC